MAYVAPFQLNTVVQYPDLTECTSSSDFGNGGITFDRLHNTIHTEFAFATTVHHSTYINSNVIGLQNMGFTAVSAMKNWHPAHNGAEYCLHFWWKRIHTGADVLKQPTHRTYWGANHLENSTNLKKYLGASGCGFKLGEPPLLRTQFFQFFTCLRMPLEPTKIQAAWLKGHNFRLVANGKWASFWINGWDPKAWTIENEHKYFSDRGFSLHSHEAGHLKRKPKAKKVA